MTHPYLKTIGALAALALIASWGMSTRATRVLANDGKDRDREREESKIEIGFGDCAGTLEPLRKEPGVGGARQLYRQRRERLQRVP